MSDYPENAKQRRLERIKWSGTCGLAPDALTLLPEDEFNAYIEGFNAFHSPVRLVDPATITFTEEDRTKLRQAMNAARSSPMIIVKRGDDQ